MNQTLHVRIISPKQLILDAQALSVSSKNSQGSFDILPLHANFLTLIENFPILVQIDKKKQLSFKYPLAIIYVSQNNVNVYTYSSDTF